ncbi:MAG TPA: glutamate racemase [Pyrinomonadaceae bacterium]
MNPNLPIGIFDSGVGGLTVYRALHERLPAERFVYLGDTARVPYGTKSLATVEHYAVENARFLAAHGVKLLVVACNTMSALALPAISAAVRLPLVGVIEPGARAAARATRGAKVGVIATEATVQSGAYERAIRAFAPRAEVVARACPLFVALAEEGWAETEVARLVAAEYLRDFAAGRVDVLVLGCTHYPILRGVIGATLGAGVELIDSGAATAEMVEELLAREGLRRRAFDTQTGRLLRARAPARRLCDDLDHFYVTDAAERFARVAELFLGSAPARLEAVEVWGRDALQPAN